jgi:hypothetical protein
VRFWRIALPFVILVGTITTLVKTIEHFPSCDSRWSWHGLWRWSSIWHWYYGNAIWLSTVVGIGITCYVIDWLIGTVRSFLISRAPFR